MHGRCEVAIFCPPQHTPIYDISHTVPCGGAFWARIRAFLGGRVPYFLAREKKKTLSRGKMIFDIHNRGAWTHWCGVSKNDFSMLGISWG